MNKLASLKSQTTTLFSAGAIVAAAFLVPTANGLAQDGQQQGTARAMELRSPLYVSPNAASAQLTLQDYDQQLGSAQRRIRLGAIGLPVSIGAFGAGAVLVTIGALGNWCLLDEPSCELRSPSDKAKLAAGAIAIAASLGGLVWSSFALARGTKSKREVRRQRPELDVALRATGASLRLRF